MGFLKTNQPVRKQSACGGVGGFSLPRDKALQRLSPCALPETDKLRLRAVTPDWFCGRNLGEGRSRLPFMPSAAAYSQGFT